MRKTASGENKNRATGLQDAEPFGGPSGTPIVVLLWNLSISLRPSVNWFSALLEYGSGFLLGRTRPQISGVSVVVQHVPVLGPDAIRDIAQDQMHGGCGQLLKPGDGITEDNLI
jgi:hypothetical protein